MPFRIYENINVLFTMTGPFAKLANQAERKTVIRNVLRAGGEWFRIERIPLRFTDYVYRLGYRVSEDWKKFKRRVLSTRRAVPFIGTTPPGGGTIESMITGMPPVTNGEKMSVAASRARTEIIGTGKGGTILIRIPYGHAILPHLADSFRNVMPEEYQRVAQVCSGAMTEFMATNVVPGEGRSKKLFIRDSTAYWHHKTAIAKRDANKLHRTRRD